MIATKQDQPRGRWLDAWHVNPSSNREYDFIDGLRGVAILMVLLCHHFYINPQSGPVMHFVGAFTGACGRGVELFFALSGFLISWPFWKRKFADAAQVVPPGYAQRRFWKIYPPLALSVIFLTPIYSAIHHDGSYFRLAAEWLSGLPFLVPVSGKFNPVMWTLVVEVQFYVVLPFVFFLFKKTPRRVSLGAVFLTFLVIPTVFHLLTGWSAGFYPKINSHFPVALNSFCLGILVAGLDRGGYLTKGWAHLGWAGVILWPAALILTAWSETHPAWSTAASREALGYLIKIASGCLLLFVANPQHPVARMLCAPWLRWCGIISYEWYLVHQPFVGWSRYFFAPAGGSIGKYVLIVGGPFVVSTLLAAAVYRYFSLPILKYGRSSK